MRVKRLIKEALLIVANGDTEIAFVRPSLWVGAHISQDGAGAVPRVVEGARDPKWHGVMLVS
jgi:hypothetical protein